MPPAPCPERAKLSNYSGNRKAPPFNAAECEIGARKKGLDAKMYEVVSVGGATRRWHLSKRVPVKPEKPDSKRKPNAYMNFCKAKRNDIVKKYPDSSFGEVGKHLGEAWRNLSATSKKKYE